MAQVFHFGPYYWFGPFETGLPPGAQHSWSWGPNPGFARSGLLATAHPEPNPIVVEQVERQLSEVLQHLSHFRVEVGAKAKLIRKEPKGR
jgi:hypothetical protein